MRSILVGIIVLAASMAAVHPAQAQTHLQRPSNYGYVRTPVDPRQLANDDLKSIEKDDQDLELPASQEDIVGAGQVPRGRRGSDQEN
jgi:hypothetical protein